MVNVERFSKFGLMLLAPPTLKHIPFANTLCKLLPSLSFSELSCFAYSKVRMILTSVMSKVTGVVAKHSTLCRKITPKWILTLQAFYSYKSFFGFIGASKRAAKNMAYRVGKLFGANPTIHHSFMCLLMSHVAIGATECQFTSSRTIWHRKLIFTKLTIPRLSLNLRFRLALSSAVNSRASVGFKFFSAKRTGLNHD